ncbi:hypothetical protein [Lichenibacterium dinghuense]|uniref:hypothetical protein n=1 Tax=Lichenibacterium dinghuense TaxID=2895977 RepID=UPI001F263762|nr:hypothetical protein [Lichenibacterium sp. 6Y81]
MGSNVTIRDIPPNEDDKGEETLISELDHVIHSMEQGINRVGQENRASPITQFLLRAMFYGSLLGIYVSVNPDVHWKILNDRTGIVSVFVLISVLAIYAYELSRTLSDRRRRLRMFTYQVRTAEETAGSVRSWVDRSNLSSRLKHLMRVRAEYLEALLSEAKSMVSGSSRWLY